MLDSDLFPPLLIRCIRLGAVGSPAHSTVGMPPSLSASQNEVAGKVVQRFPISAHETNFARNSEASLNCHGRGQVYIVPVPGSRVGAQWTTPLVIHSLGAEYCLHPSATAEQNRRVATPPGPHQTRPPGVI